MTSTISGSPWEISCDRILHRILYLLTIKQGLSELRVIPKDGSSRYAVANALGKACYDGKLITGPDYDEDLRDFFGHFF
ncbi:hypothetical protein E4U19_001767 [Claviceps sp. Clav32 group G5]|nr:hypothetical protein E4U19_001767 [Claviceps sp. Clav32 group G5]